MIAPQKRTCRVEQQERA